MIVALAVVFYAVYWGEPSLASADVGTADPYIDRLAEAADTPTLDWAECDDGFQCATAEVPLDYNQPHDEQIELAVIKLPAADASLRIGTLFINFGGPGQSGVDRLRSRARWPWLFSEELRSRFDLVSWDPRAVSRSAGVRCFSSTAEQQQFLDANPEVATDVGGEQEVFAWSQDFAERCREHAGPILQHASSTNTARDLELLRRAVGDPELTYYGISYGTQVGAIYANLFPARLRAMAFDGSLDFEGNANGHGSEGTTVPLDIRQGAAISIAATFEKFLHDCVAAGPRCAFSQGDPTVKWAVLAERLRREPITVDGRPWIDSMTIDAALPEPATYPQLAMLLQAVFDTGNPIPQLIYDITGSGPPGTAGAELGDEEYVTSRVEAFYSIQCSDSTVPTDPAVYSRAAAIADVQVPYFGRISVFGMTPCAFWQGYDADRYTGPWNRPTSAPILILNNRYDPATPLEGAQEGAAELDRARVVVIEGAGHTSMYVPSTCAELVKREYLFSGELPPASTSCSRDHSPFEQAP